MNIKRTMSGMAAAGLVLATVACSDESKPAATVTETKTVSSTSAPAATVAVTSVATETVTASASQTGTPSGTEGTAPAKGGSGFPTGTPGTKYRYLMGSSVKSFLFVSPTGNIQCGVVNADSATPTAGCQTKFFLPKDVPNCSRPDIDAPIVTFGTDLKTVKVECTHQGIFNDRHANTLPYGSQFTVDRFTFVSKKDGVYARYDVAGNWFKVSTEGIERH